LKKPVSTGGKLNKSFRYEIVSLDTKWFAVLKFKLFGKPTLLVHGQYNDKEKALKHLRLFFDGSSWILDTKTGDVLR